MSKPLAHKVHPPSESARGLGVVRSAKVIPVMGRPLAVLEPLRDPRTSQCTGHCGHCDVHPCQLHATV